MEVLPLEDNGGDRLADESEVFEGAGCPVAPGALRSSHLQDGYRHGAKCEVDLKMVRLMANSVDGRSRDLVVKLCTAVEHLHWAVI